MAVTKGLKVRMVIGYKEDGYKEDGYKQYAKGLIIEGSKSGIKGYYDRRLFKNLFGTGKRHNEEYQGGAYELSAVLDGIDYDELYMRIRSGRSRAVLGKLNEGLSEVGIEGLKVDVIDDGDYILSYLDREGKVGIGNVESIEEDEEIEEIEQIGMVEYDSRVLTIQNGKLSICEEEVEIETSTEYKEGRGGYQLVNIVVKGENNYYIVSKADKLESSVIDVLSLMNKISKGLKGVGNDYYEERDTYIGDGIKLGDDTILYKVREKVGLKKVEVYYIDIRSLREIKGEIKVRVHKLESDKLKYYSNLANGGYEKMVDKVVGAKRGRLYVDSYTKGLRVLMTEGKKVVARAYKEINEGNYEEIGM